MCDTSPTKRSARAVVRNWIGFAAISSVLLIGLGTAPVPSPAPQTARHVVSPALSAQSFSFLSLFIRSAHAEAVASESLRIYHINVGQGDATVIVGPGSLAERKVMLVDAGDTTRFGHVDGGLRVIQALQRLGIQKLDYVVLTHFDADHVGGFATGRGQGHSVLMGEDSAPGVAGLDDDGDGQGDWLDTEKVVPDREEMGKGDDFYQESTLFIDRGDAGVNSTGKNTNDRYRSYANPARRHKVTGPSKLGKVVKLGEGAKATVVCGNGWVWGRTTKVPKVTTENEKSVGMLVTFEDFDYLVAGDLIGQRFQSEDANVEEPLADALVARDIKVEVLHVGHHGASNTSRPEFIEKLAPRVGIISVGNRNGYDHPTVQTLTTLYGRGVKVYQTEKGEHDRVAGLGQSTVLGGHILVEASSSAGDAQAQPFAVRSWGSMGNAQVEDAYTVR